MSALVLVADADPFKLRMLTEVCESGGYRVITAHDGESAGDPVGYGSAYRLKSGHGSPVRPAVWRLSRDQSAVLGCVLSRCEVQAR